MGAPRRWGALASLVCGCLSVVIAQQAKIRNEVTGYLGKSVVLPCTFVPSSPEIQVSQVTWVKEDGGRRPNLAVYHPRHGPSYPMEKNSRRIRFRTESLEDATLVIQHLLMTDEDMYTCEFATFPNGNEYRITNLTVLATPTSSAWAEEVKAGGVEQPAATCMATDGKPPARITWLSRLNGNASVVQVANPNGTFTVISHYHVVPTKEANEQQITCLVEHTTLPQPEALTVQLSVLYAPEVTIEGYDDNWYLSRTEAVLTCNAKGNPPPKDFLWTTSSGSLPRSAEVQGPRLVVRNMDYSANTTFICQATNRVGQVTSQQVVLVRGNETLKENTTEIREMKRENEEIQQELKELKTRHHHLVQQFEIMSKEIQEVRDVMVDLLDGERKMKETSALAELKRKEYCLRIRSLQEEPNENLRQLLTGASSQAKEIRKHANSFKENKSISNHS